MSVQLRLVLALWTAVVVGGSALSVDVGCCDPICCDEPCAPTPTQGDPCACCVLCGPESDDPALPAAPTAKTASPPATFQALVEVGAPAPAPAPAVSVTAIDPPPARSTVLRI